MKRWLIAFSIPFVTALVLWATVKLPMNHELPALPKDELLAFELFKEEPMMLKIPGGIDEVALSTWCVVTPQQPYDPATLYPYALSVQLLDWNHEVIGQELLEPETRVSLGGPGSADGRSAWLVDSTDWVTDSRTMAIRTASRLPSGGYLRLVLQEGGVKSMLLRGSFRERRMNIERAAHEESLNIDERRKMMGVRSSLGSSDLPDDAKTAALLYWGRRLDAVGIEGNDYHVRRLLLSDFRAPLPSLIGASYGTDIGKSHWAAINTQRPIRIEALSPHGIDLHVEKNGTIEYTAQGPEGKTTVIKTLGDKPQTLVLSSNQEIDSRVRFIVQPQDVTAQIGAVFARALDENRAEISPDIRTFRFYALDQQQPIVARVAPGQRLLRVVVRGELAANDTRPGYEATVTARWKNHDTTQSASITLGLVRSHFDRFKLGPDSTEPRAAILRIPMGVEQVELVGDPTTKVSLYVDDPNISEDILRLPYRVALAEKEVFKNAPHDVMRWGHILPANHQDLDQSERLAELRAQVRIELQGEGRPAPPERVILPNGTPVERHLMEYSDYSPGSEFPLDAWNPLSIGANRVNVDKEGPRAASVVVTYLLANEQLGQTLRLLVDDNPRGELVAMVRTGEMKAAAEPGPRTITIDGMGNSDQWYINAAPAVRKRILRRRVMSEVNANAPLTFAIPQPPGTPLTVVLYLASETASEPWQLRYDIDHGGAVLKDGKFFRAISHLSGGFGGRTGEAGIGTFWEADSLETRGNQHGLSKVKIPIGDDLEGSLRTVRIQIDHPDRLWVRAIVVGEPDPAMPDGVRVWAEGGP